LQAIDFSTHDFHISPQKYNFATNTFAKIGERPWASVVE
jgi:hypothetical protein